SAPDDLFSQVLWRSARARIRSRRGDASGAEALAPGAGAPAGKTDPLNTPGGTPAAPRQGPAPAREPPHAGPAPQRAASRFEQKGNTASLELVRATLAALTYTP